MDKRNLLPDSAGASACTTKGQVTRQTTISVSYIGLLEQVSHLTRGFSFSSAKENTSVGALSAADLCHWWHKKTIQTMTEHNRKKCNKH